MKLEDLIIKGTITDITVKMLKNNVINVCYTIDGEKCSLVLPIESFLRKYLNL